jgi:hypothetical protein
MTDVATAPAKGGAKTAAAPPPPTPPAQLPAAAAPVAPRRCQLPERFFKPAEASHAHFHAVAPAEHTLDDLRDPNYLNHVKIARVRRHDRIIIDHADGRFSAELYVVDVDTDTGKVAWKIDREIDRTTQEIVRDDLQTATIQQRGDWYTVENGVRVLKGGFATRGMAEAWLEAKRVGKV